MNFWDHFELEKEHTHSFLKGKKKEENEKKPSHMRQSCEFCSEHWGTTVRLFGSQSEFEDSEVYGGEDAVRGDSKAKIAVWPGKNNVGRNPDSYWLTAPVHVFCGCEIDMIETRHESDEELEDWYSKLEWD